MITLLEGAPAIPDRPVDSHKGTFGKALLVAGSRGMSGAAALSGWGALRGGAGLVEIACPVSILPIVAGMEPAWMTRALPEDPEGRISLSAFDRLAERWAHCSAMAIGPGWGLSSDLEELAAKVVRDCPKPLVVDADGLTAMVPHQDLWKSSPASRVITPHPGEFSRLCGVPTATIQADRVGFASRYARENRLVVVLKGHGTVVTDGERVVINPTGNSGMATGGTGDVLTGLTTALLARSMEPFEAARLAVFLHGRAGDLAAADLSEPGLISSDLPGYLGKAWLSL